MDMFNTIQYAEANKQFRASIPKAFYKNSMLDADQLLVMLYDYFNMCGLDLSRNNMDLVVARIEIEGFGPALRVCSKYSTCFVGAIYEKETWYLHVAKTQKSLQKRGGTDCRTGKLAVTVFGDLLHSILCLLTDVDFGFYGVRSVSVEVIESFTTTKITANLAKIIKCFAQTSEEEAYLMAGIRRCMARDAALASDNILKVLNTRREIAESRNAVRKTLKEKKASK